MDEKTEMQVQMDFYDFNYEVNLWNIIGGGSGVKKLQKLVDAIHNGSRSIKPTKILLTGSESKTITAFAFVNSLGITEGIKFAEAKYIDAGLTSSKWLFSSNKWDSAIIIANVNTLNGIAEGNIWSFLKLGKSYYQDFQSKQYDIIHANGFVILTSKNLTGVAAEIVDAVDFVVEIENNNDRAQLEKILIQRLKYYLKFGFDEMVINLLLNSCNSNITLLLELLKWSMVNMLSEGREKLIVQDVDRAITNYK